MSNHTLFSTYSGKLFDFSNMRTKDICLEDIAHHLSRINRYNGALDMFYSVAEHCINCSKAAKTLHYEKGIELRRLALMHDAAEAYIGDVNSGLKSLLPIYKDIEKRLEDIIFEKYNISRSRSDIMRIIDVEMMLTESHYLNSKNYFLYRIHTPLQYDFISDCQSFSYNSFDFDKTKKEFLSMCDELDIKD